MPPAFQTIATDTHNAYDYTESMLPYDSSIGKANEKKEAIGRYKNKFGGRSKSGITSHINYVIQPVGGNIKEFTILEQTPYQTNITSYFTSACYLAFGRLSAIKAFIVQHNSLAAHINNYNNQSASCPGVYATGYNYKQLIVDDIIRKPKTSPPPPPPFPNPPPKKKNKMDECCKQNLAFLRLIYTKLGLAKFPGKLPNTIIQEIAAEGEEPAEPPQVPIPDLVSLLNWTFERDDERWGQWVVQIDVKDADITKEGDQGKQIKFPNLAESIAEMEGQILSMTTNIDSLVAITTKNLVESGLGRQEAIKSYLAAKAIIKYMAFKTTEIDVDIPACFTPEAQSIHELINESTIHFKGIDYTEKETLRDIYLDLLQAAAIIRAVHWQRIDTKRDTKSQLLDVLKSSVGLVNSINSPTKSDGTAKPNSKQDFEDFIDTVEDGFRNVAGVTDSENPYGKTPDRRPRIRQVGDNISQAGGKK
jgi:hypothetical protein